MVTFREDVKVRDSGVIYQSVYEQIRKLYARSPEQAGELAIAAIGLVLTGEVNSDDFMIDIMLENLKAVNDRDVSKWDKKKQASRQSKIEKQQLDLIAEMYLNGVKQKDIAARLNTTPQTISNRVALIKTEFPELLQKNQVNQVNQSNQEYVNVNVNVNDNVNIENIERSAQIPQGLPCAKAQGRKEQPNSEEEFKKAWGML